MTHRVRVVLSVALLPVALIVGVNTIFYRPFESPRQRAYRLCLACADLEPVEVDDQIIKARSAPGTREHQLRLFVELFDDPADAKACTPCTEAVLDAAE